ncbi:uncharacterized protein LOC130373810 [Gadus chalcogrammus]|uniref:uncharacterized protein LOC130373810 n=1 Tax=Gadus chalcogrammus TaxID=1042646 RepID=UPI0024C475BF|nr:uncharacterized protein LOC130373810 [Gadus chalcogrammus]
MSEGVVKEIEVWQQQVWGDHLLIYTDGSKERESVFGCTNEHKSLYFVPSSEPLKNQWVNFIVSGNAPVCAKHFTDDCFLNLGQYRAGLAQRLRIKSGSVPTLHGSATNLEKASSSSAYIQQLLSRDVACQTDHLETRTVGTQLSLKTSQPHFKSEEDCDAFGDRSTQRNATSESLGVDAPGSSHWSSHSEELKILSVYGKGEGPLATDGHDTLFTASEVESLNSLSADQSVAKSLERGERLVCREELSVQVGNHLLIHPPKERLPLLQFYNKPIESPHLYGSVNVFIPPNMPVLCTIFPLCDPHVYTERGNRMYQTNFPYNASSAKWLAK